MNSNTPNTSSQKLIEWSLELKNTIGKINFEYSSNEKIK